MERPRRMLFWRTDGKHAENSTAERSTTRNRSSLGEMQRERREGKEVELCFGMPPLLFDLAAPSKRVYPLSPPRAERPLHSRARGIRVAAALRAQMPTAARACYGSFKLVCRPV